MARIDFRIYFHLFQRTRYALLFMLLRPIPNERLGFREIDVTMITSRVIDSIATIIFWTAQPPAYPTPGSVVQFIHRLVCMMKPVNGCRTGLTQCSR